MDDTELMTRSLSLNSRWRKRGSEEGGDEADEFEAGDLGEWVQVLVSSVNLEEVEEVMADQNLYTVSLGGRWCW